MDLQRAAGQGESKTQQDPQPQANPMVPCGLGSVISHCFGRLRAASPCAWPRSWFYVELAFEMSSIGCLHLSQGLAWDPFEAVLGSIWVRFGVGYGSILGRFVGNSVVRMYKRVRRFMIV